MIVVVSYGSKVLESLIASVGGCEVAGGFVEAEEKESG